MKQPVKISIVHLFIINEVRSIRFNLGIGQKDVQNILGLNPDGNLLGSVESNFQPDRYNDTHLHKLAKAFTERSRSLNQEVIYTVTDFYPPAETEEKMVEKSISKTPEKLGQTGTLHLLLMENEDSFFNEWHTVTEIANHCGEYAKKKWSNNDFTAIVKVAVDDDKLIRKSDEEALFKRR